MKGKKAAAAITLAAALVCTPAFAAGRVSAATPSAAASSATASVKRTSNEKPGPRCRRHGGHGAMRELAKLTGLTPEQLAQKYPQQTAWQIAHTMGRLDALKAAVRSTHKARMDQMVKDGVLTSSDRDKMLKDLDRRLAAIDGTKTVILGRPGYRPQLKKGARPAPQTSHQPAA